MKRLKEISKNHKRKKKNHNKRKKKKKNKKKIQQQIRGTEIKSGERKRRKEGN